ncbi:hypothetical protein SAMN05428974_1343 [Sphingopyxis sp. YR583]|nr:hypothetical protein SAMN05428974_1343 [Sphingopyxis sp. YR583]
MALESLDALDMQLMQPTDPDDHIKLITESALLNNALILYVRATKTDSRERDGFDLRARFDEGQKRVHKELCDLRDSAIAHFGSGGEYGGEWQAELVILQFKGSEAKPAVATRRQTVDRKLAHRARKQIELALGMMRALALDRLGEITEALNAAAAADPTFSEEIGRHPLNFDIFMKSSVAADAARASFSEGGYTKGGIRHD